MLQNILIFTLCCHVVVGRDQKSTLNILRRPIHEFSMRILERVSEDTKAHFTLAPLAAWLQLSALAEGATDRSATVRELRKTLGLHPNRCTKNKLGKLLNQINKRLYPNYVRKSALVIDELLAVNQTFVKNLARYYQVKVFSKNFAFPKTLAKEVNKYMTYPAYRPLEFLDQMDFEGTTMVVCENVFFKVSWKKPFNAGDTLVEDFYGSYGMRGKVNMMRKVDFYRTAELSLLNTKALEIPCEKGISMIILLPTKNIWIGNIFYDLQHTTISYITSTLSAATPKMTSVKLPRFQINSTTDHLPELYNDMGVRKLFNVQKVELSRVSFYPQVMPSLLTQTASVEVTEEGVTAAVEYLTLEPMKIYNEFHVNSPFAFLVIDKNFHLTYMAGAYSHPSLT